VKRCGLRAFAFVRALRAGFVVLAFFVFLAGAFVFTRFGWTFLRVLAMDASLAVHDWTT
jgi:hypothetical protein